MNISDSRLLVVESKLRDNFYPLTLTKPGASLVFGTGPLLGSIERNLSMNATDICVPKYMEEYVKEIYCGINVNQHISSECVVVNSFISHRAEIWNFIGDALKNGLDRDIVHVDQYDNLVFARLGEFDPSILKKIDVNSKDSSSIVGRIRKKVLPVDVANFSLFRHPWELIRENSQKIAQDYSDEKFSSLPEFPSARSSDIEIRGSKTAIAESADVERFVTLDSRGGPIIIDEEAEVQSFTHIMGPCYVGKKTKVRSGRIRDGTSIGHQSKVAGEIEQSVISEFTNKSHDGFIGHSLVGSWVNLGALTTCSDLKNTYGEIRVKLGRKFVNTGEIKVGVFIGDMCKTAIGTLLSSGKRLGVASQVFGLVAEDVPSFTMYGKSLGARSSEVILDSAILTQKRMMERRGVVLSETMASLIRSVYKMTREERAFQRVSKARFKPS